MNSEVSIRRSRGVVSGVVLVLLGLWGGLAPFIGPYIHFGYTPDKAWTYSTGRLYFSVIPGAVTLLGGLMVSVTRNRVLGVIGGVLAALSGAWFIVGTGVASHVLKLTAVSVGLPLGAASSTGPLTLKEYLETLALFGGLGAVIAFFGALAAGRLSLVTAGDVAYAEGSGYYPEYPAASTAAPAPDAFNSGNSGQFPTVAGQFPSEGVSLPTRPSAFQRSADEYSEPPSE
jgi:hypothetical protein